MVKYFCVCFLICIFLMTSGCKQNKLAPIDNSLVQSSTSDVIKNNNRYDPKFLDINSGTQNIGVLPVGDCNLPLWSQSSFLFTQHENYVVRYDINNNKIDKIVDLGNVYENWSFKTSYSSNGRYIISNMFDPNNENPKLIGCYYFLIDLKSQTKTLLAEVYDENRAIEVTSLIPQESRSDYYDLAFSTEILKNALLSESLYLKDIDRRFEHISCVAIDSNRAGLLIPTTPGLEDILGNYRFMVLDLQSDKIVQECHLSSQ